MSSSHENELNNVSIVKVGNSVITITIKDATRYLGITEKGDPFALNRVEYDMLKRKNKIASLKEPHATELAKSFGGAGFAVQINFVDPVGAAAAAAALRDEDGDGGNFMDDVPLAKGQVDDETSLLFVQQQIDNFKRNLEAAGVQSNPADQQLLTDLQALRAKTIEPRFFDRMNEAFEDPFKRAVNDSGVYDEIKQRLSFIDSTQESELFDTRLKECLHEMMSARKFYTTLAFTAFYKRSLFRLFAGVACTYFEAETAFTIATSIINNALYTATLTKIKNIDEAVRLLNNAYQTCNRDNIIGLLTYLGIAEAFAREIYNKMVGLTIEQMKFVLKCLFLKKVVGGIQDAEHPGRAPAQGQPPTFFELISNPGLFLQYLRSIGPGVHGVVGAPDVSLEGRVITSFQEIMTFLGVKTTGQLNIVFPGTADDEIKMILFKLLLNLDDDSTENDILIKFALLRHRLYGCLEEKYMTARMRPKQFHTLCLQVCPGLLESGLTQDTVERIYGQRTDDSSQASNRAVAGDSAPQVLNEPDETTVSRVMNTLRRFPSTVAEHAKNWFENWFPEKPRSSTSIAITTNKRGHVTLEFMKACDAIKDKFKDKNQKNSVDAVRDAFMNTVIFDTKGNLRLDVDTDYHARVKKFNENMEAVSKIAKGYENFKLSIRTLLYKFQEAAYNQFDEYCELLTSAAVPFGGNSLAMLDTNEEVIKRMTQLLQIRIKESEQMIEQIIDTPEEIIGTRPRDRDLPGPAQGGMDQSSGMDQRSGMDQGGGRSRSRKRSASKRTRRKGVAKKQKSKKNKRQSRRKVRRASSRKSRK